MIVANNVTVLFKNGLWGKPIPALVDFSIEIDKGAVFALLGPNGAGKSTAMYCFLGLIQPNSGEINVLGQKPIPGAKLLNDIAYLPEDPNYHNYLTVYEAIHYYSSLYHKSTSKAQINDAIKNVGMQDAKNLRLDKCSKGMKQKVGIASCLIHTPKILFLDEPTRGLDPIILKEFKNILHALHEKGITIIINSHVLSEIELLCNQVAIMDHGKVVLQDRLKNLIKFDSNTYSLEISSTDTLPEYFQKTEESQASINGTIATDQAEHFFKFARKHNIDIYECSLAKATLEDVFFDVIQSQNKTDESA